MGDEHADRRRLARLGLDDAAVERHRWQLTASTPVHRRPARPAALLPLLRSRAGMGSAPIVIVGGGLVGLATARALRAALPAVPLVVLEKEPDVARHQSGHNSGILHSGLYYKPGSLKARFTREGRRRLIAFCGERGIRHEVCGEV